MTANFSAESPLKVIYCVEQIQNFALARNRALANAEGQFAAFIDDDEFPEKDWLFQLYKTCQKYNVAGVLGPVLPHFEPLPPEWVRKGGFYNRPRYLTGRKLNWDQCRTGNVLFRTKILTELNPPFRAEYRTGGEDLDFFRRAMLKGNEFIWCDEAVAHEIVPPHRCKRRFLLNRALLRGNNTLKHPEGQGKNIFKSFLAVPLYLMALPILLVAGHHYFMKYLIKCVDHAGRLLAWVGMNPVRERQM